MASFLTKTACCSGQTKYSRCSRALPACMIRVHGASVRTVVRAKRPLSCTTRRLATPNESSSFEEPSAPERPQPPSSPSAAGDKAKASGLPHHLPVSAFMPPPARQLLHQLADCVLIFNVHEADEAAGAADSEPGGEAAAASSLTSQQAVQAHTSILAAGSQVLAQLLQEQLSRHEHGSTSITGSSNVASAAGGAAAAVPSLQAWQRLLEVPGMWTPQEFEGALRALSLITLGSMELLMRHQAPLALSERLPPPPAPPAPSGHHSPAGTVQASASASASEAASTPPAPVAVAGNHGPSKEADEMYIMPHGDVYAILAVYSAARRLGIPGVMHAAVHALSAACSGSRKLTCDEALQIIRTVSLAPEVPHPASISSVIVNAHSSESVGSTTAAKVTADATDVSYTHAMNQAIAGSRALDACTLALARHFTDAPAILNSKKLKEEFANLPLSAVHALLNDGSPFATDCENSVLALVCYWVHHNADAVAGNPAAAAALRESVRVARLTDEYLFTVLPMVTWFGLTAHESAAFAYQRSNAQAAGLPSAWFRDRRHVPYERPELHMELQWQSLGESSSQSSTFMGYAFAWGYEMCACAKLALHSYAFHGMLPGGIDVKLCAAVPAYMPGASQVRSHAYWDAGATVKRISVMGFVHPGRWEPLSTAAAIGVRKCITPGGVCGDERRSEHLTLHSPTLSRENSLKLIVSFKHPDEEC